MIETEEKADATDIKKPKVELEIVDDVTVI